MAPFKKWFYTMLQRWLPLAIALSIMSLLIYAGIQQSFRQTANDPQIQMAEDAANDLSQGAGPETVLPQRTIDIAKSLSPYMIIYDESGRPVRGSGLLNEKLPGPPSGVFDFTRQNGRDIVTWQPQPGVRSAIVVIHFKGQNNSGFVLVGRSLREIEIREDRMSLIVLMGWLAGLFATFIVSLI
jgi:hypothetical protein